MSPTRIALKRTLVGRRMPLSELEGELLPKRLALPIFASDPLSSVAYATEAGMLVLITASLASRTLIVPISLVIAALLAIVVLSYRQTIYAYPNGGGSYVVAKENLGAVPGLVAAASLLTDYVLTVAVSIASGVLAVTSAVPELASHAVALSLAVLVLLVLVNLRGVRESGYAFALPTYAFIGSVGALVAVGFVRGLVSGWPTAHVPDAAPVGLAGSVGLIVVLRAFASGCSALTGVEAISNGVPAFRRPQAVNASRTLMVMGGIAILLFIGVSVLAWKMDARPSGSVSLLSEIARTVFPPGSTSFGYYLVQASTAAVLALAANTAFQGFPRLSALLASDSYLPRQFANLGDRLVFSNGIIVLAVAAGALIVGFNADVNSLIHLYLLGVFTAFTLSQFGMVRRSFTLRGQPNAPGWGAVALNGTGGLLTGLVGLIVLVTKFTEGAWMVTIAIPVLVLGFALINRHYRDVTSRLQVAANTPLPRVAARGRSCSTSTSSTTRRPRPSGSSARSPAIASRPSTSPRRAASPARGVRSAARARPSSCFRRAEPCRAPLPRGCATSNAHRTRSRPSSSPSCSAGVRCSPRSVAGPRWPCDCACRASGTSWSRTCRWSRDRRTRPRTASSAGAARRCCCRSRTTMPPRGGRSPTRSVSGPTTSAGCTSPSARTMPSRRVPSGQRVRSRSPSTSSRRPSVTSEGRCSAQSAPSRRTRMRSASSCSRRSSARIAGSASCTTSAACSSSACCSSRSA